ncbi:MAG: aminotransferase class V-fold PLP-dependent enzyme [Bauldia sp.]
MTLTSDEVARLRAETAACFRRIHLDSAGSSLMPDAVFREVAEYMALERDVGGYAAAEEARPDLEAMYENLAALLGAQPIEIAFAESATRAWDFAFSAIPFSPGDRIIAHASEYGSNYLSMLHLARRRGLEIDLVSSDGLGRVDVSAIETAIAARTKLVAVTHVAMHEGLIQPVEEIGRVARDHGLIYLLDACQAVGQLTVDVKRIGCHILAGTGRKYLRAPRGTGFLYVSSDIVSQLDPTFLDMRSAVWSSKDSYEFVPGARRFEAFESNIAGRVGLAAATRYAMAVGLPKIEAYVRELAEDFRDALRAIGGVEVCDRGGARSGMVTFVKDGVAPKDLARRLRAEGIVISAASIEQAWLGLGERDLSAVARASVHYFNTREEIERACDAISRS